MAEERVERRLAAILAADVVGYSAFVGQDEEGTIRALKGHLSALEPIIGLHAGRIVKFVGDGFLAEFGSVVDAVSCADAMQRRLAERNGDRPHDQCLHFRMGIHVGDIIVDGDDILGDGVNVAARLESIAKPGGITVSARVYEDVERNLDLAFADLGARELYNIARPVRIYEVVRDTREVERTILELPDKPSIAVLPFLNMSADLEQEYLADGLTEDIISALSYVPWIFVIARNSSFTYKGLSVDVRKIGRELGVRYLLEGSVRRSGDRLRVTGQLVDAKTSAHIWADHFDGTLKDVFDLQDRMTEAVVNAIAPKIREAEIERAGRKHPESLTAYDLYLRALAALNNIQITEASILLDNAIAATSDYAKAKAVRAWCYTLFSWGGCRQTTKMRQTQSSWLKPPSQAPTLTLRYGPIRVTRLGSLEMTLSAACHSLRRPHDNVPVSLGLGRQSRCSNTYTGPLCALLSASKTYFVSLLVILKPSGHSWSFRGLTGYSRTTNRLSNMRAKA
jgi:adenylate cyclase